MDGGEGPRPDIRTPTGIHYSQLLWQKADELARHRAPLTDRRDAIYAEAQQIRQGSLNLHQLERLQAIEGEYWRIHNIVAGIQSQEEELIIILGEIDEGLEPDPERSKSLLPEPEEPHKLSKKRQAVEREARRLGMTQSELAWELYMAGFSPYYEFGSTQNGTRLTTGRNRRGITGSFSPNDAGYEFFHKTTDTHGGKVRMEKVVITTPMSKANEFANIRKLLKF